MKKKDAFAIVEFIEAHYDIVGQEDWFDFCDMLLGTVVSDANGHGYAQELAKKFPAMFSIAS